MKIRIISAILLLVILIPILIVGGLPFQILALILGTLGLRELINIREKQNNIPFIIKVISYLLCLYIIASNFNSMDLILTIDYRLISAVIICLTMPIIFQSGRSKKKYDIEDAFYLMGSILIIGFSFNLVLLIRNNSLNILIYLLLITVMNDSFAYITGRYIGKHKLCPNVSPNKTVEGSIGGLLMGTFISVMFYTTIINDISIIRSVFMTLFLSISSQIGDLVFSKIKRYFNVKDYSNLIPGHGGILDRFDSIIFTIITYILFVI